MGMQVHFNWSDVPADANAVALPPNVEDPDGAIVMNPGTAIECYAVRAVDAERRPVDWCWADIGYMNDNAMKVLKFLVAHRIPFSAS